MAQTKIAGLFLDPTVISGLTAITSGASDADYLFVWDATDSLLKKILPDNLGLAAAAHTIESHDATSATGVNLETLTNAGDADTLHTHAAKASLNGAVFTGTVTTPSVLFKGSTNAVTMDVNNGVAAYSIILPDAAPAADRYLKTTSGSTSQLEWGTVTSSDTTYTHTWQDSSDNAILRLTAGGSGSGNDDLTIVAGTNITLTPSGDNLTIAAAAQTFWKALL